MSDRDREEPLQFIKERKVDEDRKIIEQKLDSPSISSEERVMLYEQYMEPISRHFDRGDHKLSVECIHKTFDITNSISGQLNIYFAAIIAMRNDAQGAELLSELFEKVAKFLLKMKEMISDPNYDEEREIFHYTSESVKESIQNEGFRFHNVKNLDDSLEGKVFLDRLSLEQQQKEELERIFCEDDESYIYSGSFTFDGESDHMWEQYGKRKSSSERGIKLCWGRDNFTRDMIYTPIFIKIDIILGPLSENFIFKKEMFLFPVIYENQLSKNLILQNILKEVSGVIKKILDRSRELKGQNQNEDGKKIILWTKVILDCFRFLFKSNDYSGEKERRVFVFRSPAAECVVKSEDREPLYVKINPQKFIPQQIIADPSK